MEEKFITKSDFDDMFEAALNRGRNGDPKHDWMFGEFPVDLSTWECCIERFEEVSNKSKMWDSLRHALKHGKWSDARTIESVLVAMDNIEHENNKNMDW